MKKFLPLLLLVGFIFLPQSAFAGSLTEGCFPVIYCPSGQDAYGGSCQTELDSVSGAAPSCASVLGAPAPGKSWAFSCDAGCYQKGGGGGSVNPCPGGIMIGGQCLIKLNVVDDDTGVTGSAGYKIWDGADLSMIAHVDTAGCADGQVPISSSSNPTGWYCGDRSPYWQEAPGVGIYVPNGLNVGIANSNPAYDLDVSGDVNALTYCLNGDCVNNWSLVSPWTVNGNDIYYASSGGVGIGGPSSTPEAKLEIKTNVIGGVGPLLNLGYNHTISGDLSVAIGSNHTVSNGGFAYGNNNTVSTGASIAAGQASTASGQRSFAFGQNATASNAYAFAAGQDTTASGLASTAMGGSTTASSSNATAMGFGSSATNSSATAMGYGTTADGFASISTGYSTEAIADYSTAIGYYTDATNFYATAMGGNTLASGQYATAMGQSTTATGQAATAMGRNSDATGSYSTAFGYNADASGTASFAQGLSSFATGNYATAMGYGTTAQAYASMAVGRYPVIAGSTSSWVATDPLFVVGNGANSSNPSNAFTVYKNGKVDATEYCINGTDCVTSWSGGDYWKEDATFSERIYFDDNSFTQGQIRVGIDTNSPNQTLSVNGNAEKIGGGTWLNFSDIRLKDIKGTYEKGLNEVIKLHPVNFRYKVDNPLELPSDEDYVGFIAQEVQPYFPEAVSEDNDGYLSFDMHPILVAMVNSVKELKAENDALKAVVCELKPEAELCN